MADDNNVLFAPFGSRNPDPGEFVKVVLTGWEKQ